MYAEGQAFVSQYVLGFNRMTTPMLPAQQLKWHASIDWLCIILRGTCIQAIRQYLALQCIQGTYYAWLNNDLLTIPWGVVHPSVLRVQCTYAIVKKWG